MADQGAKTYATFQRTTVDIEAAQLTDRHRRILMGIHLDEGEAAIRLKARFDHVTVVLEEWDQVILGSVRREVADITGCLPLRRLLNDHVIALDTMGRKVVVAEWGGGRHPHS